MPDLTNEEINAALVKGEILAISIDTAVFDAKQKNFRHSMLRHLVQLNKFNVRVLLTDVVVNEMKGHLRIDAEKTQRELKEKLESHRDRWHIEASEEEEKRLFLDFDAENFAEKEFADFLAHVRGEIISVSETPKIAEVVLNHYFSGSPPFGTEKRRKNEFPDAFALIGLEAYAARNEKFLICVSPDSAWVDFAAQSKFLICIRKFEDALALFNTAHQSLANDIVERWRKKESTEPNEEVAKAFEYYLDDLSFDVYGDANFAFDAEPSCAALQEIPSDQIGNPIVIAVDTETVTLALQVEALIYFEACFYMYVSKVDGELIEIGAIWPCVEKTVEFDLTITAFRSPKNKPLFQKVEVDKRLIKVDFGFVDAFPNEDPTYEKY